MSLELVAAEKWVTGVGCVECVACGMCEMWCGVFGMRGCDVVCSEEYVL